MCRKCHAKARTTIDQRTLSGLRARIRLPRSDVEICPFVSNVFQKRRALNCDKLAGLAVIGFNAARGDIIPEPVQGQQVRFDRFANEWKRHQVFK